MHSRRLLAYLWASPNTLIGLLLWPLSLYRGGTQVVAGVVEVHGPLIAGLLNRCTPIAGGASAMTLGHVIIGQDAECLREARQHEHVHVRQYERWGPLFLPAYVMASLIAWLRGRDPYYGNAFEREAYRRDRHQAQHVYRL